MVAVKETDAYRRAGHGQELTAKQREALLGPFLPPPDELSSTPSTASVPKPGTAPIPSKPIRNFLRNQLHLLIYTIIHTAFSFYIRLRQIYHAVLDRVFAILYYHHRTPELIARDVKTLTRLPSHISVILDREDNPADPSGAPGLEQLVDDVAEIAAWCACAGIPTLSVYEKTGLLKTSHNHIRTTHRAVLSKFFAYFGARRPTLLLRIPHMSSSDDVFSDPPDTSASPNGNLTLHLLSSDDSRPPLVDLTKTLTEMSQRGKITPQDISSDLIDAEVSESVMGEPDLLVLFSPDVKLRGYPPWQVRLTEIL